MFSIEEKKQYHRHLILNEVGEAGQAKLKKAKVLVIGAGGLGCPILQYLAAAGVGMIGIADGDTVDQSNLQRQVLYGHSDIGINKAKAAKIRLQGLNPYIEINVYEEYLTTENIIEIIGHYDIIVDGSDNFQTRYLVNDACVMLNKPLVFGSIFKFDGQVTVFNHQAGPTYRCLYPSPPAPDAVPNCSDIGVLGVLPGIIGCLQANEVIKIICGLGQVLSGKLLNIDALSLKQFILSFDRTAEADVTRLLDNYDAFCGVEAAAKSNDISYKEYLSNPDDFFLIDVRNLAEREIDHIGGIHIPLPELTARHGEIDTDRKVLFYCQSGKRSAKAVGFMKDHSSLVCYSLIGGMQKVNL